MRFHEPSVQQTYVDEREELISRSEVSALNYYPIKSCAGTALEVAHLGPRGIQGDRAFMLVDTAGQFVTQREEPRMALIKPRLRANGLLAITAPSMPELQLTTSEAGKRDEVVIWKDTVLAVDQGKDPAEWFSAFLGSEYRLVIMPRDYVRQANPKYARREDVQVGFVDGYPFLLISEASLADLNTRLEKPLPMARFRPNIVVSGTTPYEEDTWRKIRIGEVVFDIVKPCERCVITTTDQETAIAGKEPLATLATYRRSADGRVLFGQNLVHATTGTISQRDTVEILERAPTANFTKK